MRKWRIVILRLLILPAAFLVVFVGPSWQRDSMLAYWVEFIGYIIVILGLWIRMWATLYIGQRKSKQLITEGPYSICRNPLYWGTFLIAFGAGLCFESIPLAIFALVVMVPVHILVAKAEEKHLEEIFGEEYEKYKHTIPAFMPSLKHYQKRSDITVSTRAMRRVAIETAFVLLLPEIEDIVELLQGHGVIPVLWRLW